MDKIKGYKGFNKTYNAGDFNMKQEKNTKKKKLLKHVITDFISVKIHLMCFLIIHHPMEMGK
ncbi:hypothetical protein P3L47_22905 [Parabacteroides chongii]|nr:hypothetical protein [Parabacteroides chongii]WFE84931.1 hypothetical protein P3L47_22905 [Parabacteroides chongii]